MPEFNNSPENTQAPGAVTEVLDLYLADEAVERPLSPEDEARVDELSRVVSRDILHTMGGIVLAAAGNYLHRKGIDDTSSLFYGGLGMASHASVNSVISSLRIRKFRDKTAERNRN